MTEYRENSHNMGANPNPVSVPRESVRPIIMDRQKTKLAEQIRVIPVLAAAAIAAVIAVLPLQAKQSFALLCCEIGLFILSMVISVSRGPQGSKS